jgi:hypothetical protein
MSTVRKLPMSSFFNTFAVRPEIELLIQSARTSRDHSDSGKTTTLFQSNIDWSFLIQAAHFHGLIPLLYQRLNTTCPDAVPREMLNRLQGDALANTKWNLALTRELFEMLDLFQTQGIQAISFKGPLLAAGAYGDTALRQFVDLDVLVRKEHVVKAAELLVSRGYKPEFYLTDVRNAVLDRSRCEYAFYRDEVCGVDLHWAIVPQTLSFAPNPDAYWQRLDVVSLAGREVPTLSAEDLLLSLCVHGTKHFWRQLNWICDVTELVRAKKDIDWARLIARAETDGSDRMLFLGLFLGEDLLGAPLPSEVIQRIRADPTAESLASRVYRRLSEEPAERPRSIVADMFFAQTMRRVKDRARLLLGHAKDHFRPTLLELEMVSLPRPFYFLYYLLRPLRLAGKYGRRLGSRPRSSGSLKQNP